MLIANGRLQYGTNTTMFGLDGITTFRHEHPINSIGGFPRTTSVPQGYGASGIQICINGGAMKTRPAQIGLLFGGSAPINQGIGITASGRILYFSGTAGLGAIVNLAVISSPIHFGGSADIYGLASMTATGNILLFSGTANLGAIITFDPITGTITFGGSSVLHSLAHLTIDTSTGVMTEKTIAAEVWNSILASFQEVGSTGKALSSAGSAGDPWSTILPGTYTDDQAGKIMDAIKQLSELTFYTK